VYILCTVCVCVCMCVCVFIYIYIYIYIYISTRYGLDCTGIDSRWGEIFCTRPDRSWGTPSLLYNGYRVSFPGVKRPGRGVDHPPPFSAEIEERVELDLYSPSEPSWPLLGWIWPLPWPFIFWARKRCLSVQRRDNFRVLLSQWQLARFAFRRYFVSIPARNVMCSCILSVCPTVLTDTCGIIA